MKLINGNSIADDIYKELNVKIHQLKTQHNIIPGLAVMIIGDRPDSLTYINMKRKKCKQLGIESFLIQLPIDILEEQVIQKISNLNNDPQIHGILIQLPLPKNFNQNKILSQVSIDKDVDGFHYNNIGKLALKQNPKFIPCTPKGCIELLQRSNIPISGMHVVVLGRSNIVGLPLSLLLLHQDATVTICHSKTQNIKNITKNADILIAACGCMELVKKDWIKKDITIIDMGIHRKEDKTKKRGYKLVGDVDFEDVKDLVAYITPVPGGIGPMTIAMLMTQTIESAFMSIDN